MNSRIYLPIGLQSLRFEKPHYVIVKKQILKTLNSEHLQSRFDLLTSKPLLLTVSYFLQMNFVRMTQLIFYDVIFVQYLYFTTT